MFFINPEHLNGEEIEYELRIRNEIVQGNRRELSARLRTIIAEEQRGARDIPVTAYSVPSQEIDVCRSKIARLTEALRQVTNEYETQNAFMSKYLHVEGRINRIPKAKAHDSFPFE